MFIAIIWLVLFVIWAAAGPLYFDRPAGASMRSGYSVLLAILLGILGYLVLANRIQG